MAGSPVRFHGEVKLGPSIIVSGENSSARGDGFADVGVISTSTSPSTAATWRAKTDRNRWAWAKSAVV